MKFLAPNDQHPITVPVIVGAEYTLPTGDAKLVVRQSGTTVTSTIEVAEATDITFDILTPNVAAGQLHLIGVMLSAPTALGMFVHREMFGVVDSLDIPTDAEAVRTLLGVTPDELSDETIGIESHYVEVYRWMINDFHAVRQNDPYLTKRFGDLIAIIAAISLGPSMLIRLDKSRKTENGQVQRLMDPKYFQDFLDNLQDTLAKLQDDLADFLVIPEAVSVSIFEFVNAKQWSINA
ncbi:hypothetical protein [Acinetobacter phage vB_AbaS_TCUP2199]|nr:hypothetical protein [Acinetobacter phage vB_AbaS_TCUP2199]